MFVFLPSPPLTEQLYLSSTASLARVPVEHDEHKVLTYLEKFYGVARRYSGLHYDVKRVAALEFQYFDVHRRLSGKGEKKELLQTLIALRSTIL